jgi:CRP-like cAMP-binding protein
MRQRGEAIRAELSDTLGALALFADLSTPELEAIAHTFEERFFAEGERILRQGLSGSAFFVILEGDATIRLDGKDYGTLSRGDFFGEISLLLGEAPVADVVAARPLRCAVLAGPELERFLISHPRVAYRMLQAEARKLRNATRWRS